MLQLLSKRGVVRDHIERIIRDLEKDNFFIDDPIFEDNECFETEKTTSSELELQKSKSIFQQRKVDKEQIRPLPLLKKKGSPLHEAILMKDVWLARSLIKEGKYNDVVDDNGHTPKEMAYYEDCQELLILFELYEGAKK